MRHDTAFADLKTAVRKKDQQLAVAAGIVLLDSMLTSLERIANALERSNNIMASVYGDNVPAEAESHAGVEG